MRCEARAFLLLLEDMIAVGKTAGEGGIYNIYMVYRHSRLRKRGV